MKSFLVRAALFAVIFWLFVTAMIALPSFRHCSVYSAPGPGSRVTLCSAFAERPGLVRRTPAQIITGAGKTSLILTAITLVFLGLGRLAFIYIRRGDPD
jgi:hypothetical protein